MPIQLASAGDVMIWRRGLVSFVAVVIAITAPVVAASAATAPAEGSANDAHTADVRLPGSVALPVNFAPEGIAKGEGSTFYAASLATGDIYRGNLRSGQGEILVNAPAGEEAVGLKADEADRLLFVCGGTTGAAHVYNSRTGALVAQYQLAPDGTSLINYAVLTAHGAYFTDSYNPDIYEIPIGPFGRLGRAVTIPLNGPVAAFSKNGLNLNGIAATADGKTLIVDNTVLDKLFTVDPITGASAAINVAGLIPDSMDGMLLQGSSLWVVENTANTVIRVTLSHELSRGTITSTITSPLFDDPTTVAKYRNELALPNGRYNLGLPPPFGPGAGGVTLEWTMHIGRQNGRSRSGNAIGHRDRRFARKIEKVEFATWAWRVPSSTRWPSARTPWRTRSPKLASSAGSG